MPLFLSVLLFKLSDHTVAGWTLEMRTDLQPGTESASTEIKQKEEREGMK